MNIKDIVLSAKKIVLIFDLDTDGICSAKIVYEALNRMQVEINDFMPCPSGNLNDDSTIKGIENANPDLIIIVDDELRDDSKIVKKFKCNILVIDHHSIENIPHEKNVFYFNPKVFGITDYTPASKYCFDLLEKIVEISDLDWVAAVGTIADSGAVNHKKFLSCAFKKYKVKAGNDKDYLTDSYFGYLGDMINSGKIVSGNDGALSAFRVLKESSSPEDFESKAYELRQWSQDVNEYIKDIVLDFELKKEAFNQVDLYFYTFNPRYKIGSVLSTIVSFKYPDKTVVIFSKKGSISSISYRRQDKKVDMNKLARNSIKGLKNAGGGGHVPAAGGHVQTKDLNILKRNIIKEIKMLMEKNE